MNWIFEIEIKTLWEFYKKKKKKQKGKPTCWELNKINNKYMGPNVDNLHTIEYSTIQ